MINDNHPNFYDRPNFDKKSLMKYELKNIFEEPLLSIITPFYNTNEIFHETAKTILNQSFQQFEWIIVNDGSTDELSLSILEFYSKLDQRIRIINHAFNKGLSAARNTGIKNSVTNFLLLIDSDDLLEPTAAEKWFWYLKSHPNAHFVDSYHAAFGEKNYLWSGGFHEGAFNIESNTISMFCLVRKSVFEITGGFDENMLGGLEDWDFWLKCAESGIWGDTLPEYLAWYRLRNDHSDRWKNLTQEKLNEFKSNIQFKYPNLNADNFPQVRNLVDLDLTTFNLKMEKINLLNKKMKNFLIIIPWMVMGGAERFLLNLINKLKENQWNITIVTTSLSENNWKNEFGALIDDIFMLPNFLNISEYANFINYLVHSRGIDIIFLQGSLEGYRLLPVFKGLFPQVPIIDYLHFVTPDWMDGGFPRLSYIYRDCLDMTIASCEQVKQWMIDIGSDKNHLIVNPIGIDHDKWKPNPNFRFQVRRKLGIQDNEIVILYAARLEAQKQPLIFAETLKILTSRGINFYAIVAGDGSLRFALEKYINDNNLGACISLLGSVSQDEMHALYNASDIFFLPSKNEGISSAIYEAMASGVPIVGADVGGQSELVTPDCGILIQDFPLEQQSDEYARVITELILDENRIKNMKTACVERILYGYALQQTGEQFIKIINQVLDDKYMEKNNEFSVPSNELFLRNSQHIIEYIQARQEWHKKENQTIELNDKYIQALQELHKNENQIIELNNKFIVINEQFEMINQEKQVVDQQYKEIFEIYSDLISPKPPSYWFYLWIRQLFLPIFNRIGNEKIKRKMLKIKDSIKKF